MATSTRIESTRGQSKARELTAGAVIEHAAVTRRARG
jgi:hypothetical protein